MKREMGSALAKLLPAMTALAFHTKSGFVELKRKIDIVPAWE
jgi:hypothetical protein